MHALGPDDILVRALVVNESARFYLLQTLTEISGADAVEQRK